MSDLDGNMSQFYPLKAAFEQILGRKAYLNVKETSSLAAWVKESQKLLRAVRLARASTVQVADNEWHAEFDAVVELGQSHIKNSKTISELFSHLSATFARLVFLQLGMLPQRAQIDTVPFQEKHWQLDSYRTVQYVQTDAQRVRLEKLKAKRSASRSERTQQVAQADGPAFGEPAA